MVSLHPHETPEGRPLGNASLILAFTIPFRFEIPPCTMLPYLLYVDGLASLALLDAL